jgi:hypothetical protein
MPEMELLEFAKDLDGAEEGEMTLKTAEKNLNAPPVN